jgi:plasmid maintenance system antidote protein VapI
LKTCRGAYLKVNLLPLCGFNDIGVHARRINEIVHGNRSISADTALRLSRYFGLSERFWLNLQARYDLEVEKDRLAGRLEKEVKVFITKAASSSTRLSANRYYPTPPPPSRKDSIGAEQIIPHSALRNVIIASFQIRNHKSKIRDSHCLNYLKSKRSSADCASR